MPVSYQISPFVGASDNLPGSAGQHHAVVDQAQDLNNVIRRQAVYDEMAGCSNAACRFDPEAAQPRRVGTDAGQPGNVNGARHVRLVAERGHDRQDELAVSASRVEALSPGAVKKKGVDLLFRCPGKPVSQLPVSGQASLQSRHQAPMQELLVF